MKNFRFRREGWEWEKKTMDGIFDKISTGQEEVLDFACGTGRILNYLQHRFNNLTGVDVSPEMLGVTKSYLPNINVIKADLTKNNIFKEEAKSFDLITSFRFFLNAQDSLREEVLQELSKIIKPNGYLIVNNHGNATSPSIKLQKIILDYKNRSRPLEDKYISNALHENHFLEILNKYGFELAFTHHRNVIPIINEKTNFNVGSIRFIEDILSSKTIFRRFARNVIYVLRKV